MPQFHIVKIQTGLEPEIVCDDCEPIVFHNGASAAIWAESMTSTTGIKHQPRPIKTNEDWRAREMGRFEAGTYRHLPWELEPWAIRDSTKDHFAHVGVKDPGKLAYTADETKGEADTQTQIKPGRYLQAFFSDVLNSEQVTQWATIYASLHGGSALKIARTADEIEQVYREGPNSCMSHRGSNYDSGIHPVRVYAGPDLAVAYCCNEQGEICSRAVIWPEKKIYSRIYGDHYRLDHLLREEGYSSGSLNGARLTLVLEENRIVCPYIDSCSSAEIDGKFLVLGNGDHNVKSTDGYTEPEDSSHCQRCDENCNDEDLAFISDVMEYWCDDCARNSAYECAYTGNYYARRCSVVELQDGTIWSEETFERRGATCRDCTERFSAGEVNRHYRCDACQETYDKENEEENEEETEIAGRDEHEDQTELPLAGPPGCVYRIRVETLGRYWCFDGLSTTITDDLAKAERALSEARTLNPSITYTLETLTPEARLVA